MLKVTETEETIGFVVIIFILGGISIGEGGGPPCYAYVNWSRKKTSSIIELMLNCYKSVFIGDSGRIVNRD